MRATWVLVMVGALMLTVATTGAQSQFPNAGMPQQPVTVRTTAVMVKVSAVRGLVYPWALTFLPDGDMLVTEQGKNTLRRISHLTLDPPDHGIARRHHEHAPRHGRCRNSGSPEVRRQPLRLRCVLEAEGR